MFSNEITKIDHLKNDAMDKLHARKKKKIDKQLKKWNIIARRSQAHRPNENLIRFTYCTKEIKRKTFFSDNFCATISSIRQTNEEKANDSSERSDLSRRV